MEDKGAGWLTFSSIILIFAGLMRIIDGIWAFSIDDSIDDTKPLASGLLGDKISNYGFWWLLVGIVLILAGFAVLQGSQVGRWVGLIGAVIGGLSAVAWMPYYPVWSLVYVITAFLVVYALAVYGGIEMPDMGQGQSSDSQAP